MLQTRRSRVTFSALLALVAIGAGLVLWAAEQRRTSLATAERAGSAEIDDLVRAAADLDATLRQATAIDARDEGWVALIEAQIRQVDTRTSRLRPGAQPAVAAALTDLQAATRALEQAVGQIGQRGRRNPSPPPAELIPAAGGADPRPPDASAPPLSDGTPPLDGGLPAAGAEPPPGEAAQFGPFEDAAAADRRQAQGALEQQGSPRDRGRGFSVTVPVGLALPVFRVRQAHAQAFAEARAVLADRSLSAVGATAVAWTIGIALLTWWPARQQMPVQAAPAVAASALVEEPIAAPAPAPAPRAAPVPPVPAPVTAPSIDLALTARVCRDLSRLTSADQLPAILGGVANAVGAKGVILWTCSEAGLIAAAVHGYDSATVRRFGTIAIEEQTPVAVAWRTGEPAVVPASATAPAALAVPVLGPEQSVAVLAMELRAGRAADASALSAACIIAAQLAVVVEAPGRHLRQDVPAADRSVQASEDGSPDLPRAIGA